MHIRIFGHDVQGRSFGEQARTIEVSRNGALILTRRHLAPQQEILIRLDFTGAESNAQIVGQVRTEEEGFVYGVKLLDPSINLWDITFAPPSEADRAVMRTLLECGKCRLREVVYLEEYETEVYLAHRSIYHPCRRCFESTIWNEAAYRPRPVEVEAPPPPPSLPPLIPVPPAARIERRFKRIRCKLQACVRNKQQHGEELLEVNDVSRGGVCFTTSSYLSPGTRVEIAVPYSPGMANIFVPAEVVRSRAIPEKHVFECGAAYLKHP
jgi:hypothetical protein